MPGLGVWFRIEQMKSEAHRNSPRMELLYVIDGKLCITLGEQNIILQKEGMYFVNAGCSVSCVALRSGILFRISVEPSVLEEEIGGEHIEIDLDSTQAERNDTRYRQLRVYMIELIRSCLCGGNSDKFDQYSKCYLILGYLTKYFRKVNEREEKADSYQKYTDEVIRFIWENYDKQITLQDMADKLYITNSHLSRVLKKSLGKNFRSYINEVRLLRAVEELENSDKSILLIANDNGFSGLAAFNKAFKESYAVSPTVYRRRFRDKEKVREEDKSTLTEAALVSVESSFAHLMTDKGMPELEISSFVGNYTPYTKPWQDVINVGTAAELLNNKIQHHILRAKRELGYKYVRFWGIFQDELLIMPRASGDRPNFSRLDDSINFLLNNDLKPFIQMGPKPRNIIRGLGNSIMPSGAHQSLILTYDEQQWKQLVDSFMNHLMIYYGEDEINTWIFEMWNPYPWDKQWYEWFKPLKYADCSKVVKKYAPNAFFGGGEFVSSMLSGLPAKLGELEKLGTNSDFISFAMFPYEPDGVSLPPLETNINFMRDSLKKIRKMMEDCGASHKKLYLDLWNNTISSRNVLNDAVYRGAYIIKNAIDAIGEVDQLCFWQCTDAFTEDFDSDGILHGGSGIMTRDGFFKPAAYAFGFLKRLYGKLIEKNDNYMITTNGHGNYAIIYHNLKALLGSIYLKKEDALRYEDLHEAFEDNNSMKLKFKLSGMVDGYYDVRFQHVDKYSGSILDEWKQIGGFTDMPKEDKQYLENVSIPKRYFVRKKVIEGMMELELEALANGFGLIEIMFRG